MPWRIQARLRFTLASGYGQWCYDQNTVRAGQAYHLHEGEPYEELSHHEVTAEGFYVADLIWPDTSEQLAVDTFNTITAPSVIHPAYLVPPDDNAGGSHVRVHHCLHDTVPPQKCVDVTLAWSDV